MSKSDSPLTVSVVAQVTADCSTLLVVGKVTLLGCLNLEGLTTLYPQKYPTHSKHKNKQN